MWEQVDAWMLVKGMFQEVPLLLGARSLPKLVGNKLQISQKSFGMKKEKNKNTKYRPKEKW